MRSINVGGYPLQIMQDDQYTALLFEQAEIRTLLKEM